jgi:autotransporter-associated beta strand protein
MRSLAVGWLLCSIGNAQIIYYNAFSGGAVNINGTAPTVANTFAGGTSSATWNDVLGTNDTGDLLADGIDTTTLGDSWLLPFSPQSGYVYTLTASLTFTNNPGNWAGLGFAQNDSANVPAGSGRFADSNVNGYDWMILTESNGGVQYFTGPRGNTPQIYAGTGFISGPQTLTVEVVLNTTGSLWSETAYVNGVQMGNASTYAANPSISAVGITQNGLTAPTGVQWNYLTLEAGGTTVIWSGADAFRNVSTNWSDANNWTGGMPGPGNNIYFFDQGSNGTAGVVNNVVDGNTTISTLQYGNTNGFHTTQINAGVNLVVSNTAGVNLVFTGTGTDNGSTQTVYTTVKGTGTLTVLDTNGASAFVVQQGSANNGSHTATLDLSGLANFNLTAGGLMVGSATPTTGAYNWLSGTLCLAATNTIRVNGPSPALDVGNAENNGGISHVYLGQTNAIFADSMTVAFAKANATLMFNPALAGSNPTITLNGNTNSRVSGLKIGDFSSQGSSASVTTGLMDLSEGTMNVLANTCSVALGQSGSGSGPTTGTLRLGAGRFNVNTLNVGQAGVSTAVGNVTGSVWLTNGTLVVNGNLVLSYNAGSTAKCSGTLAVTNGTVLANEITAGGGTSAVSLSGGLLLVSNTMGSLAAPLMSLAVNQGGVLEFQVTSQQTNAAVTSVTSDNSGVLGINALPTVFAYPSQYPLIYCPAGGASGVKFSLGTLPGSYQGYISNDNASMIWLVITNGPALPRVDEWGGGVNNNWDTSTLNWTNGGTAVAYSEGDSVLFNDLAQTSTVNIVGTAPHTPFTWLVTNTVLNYVFTGTNGIGGAVNLIKAGARSLTLAEASDDFAGGITINNGLLILDETTNAISGGLNIASGATAQIGNNDAKGNLPAGMIFDYGSLIFNQSITDLVSATISGSGTLTQEGSGILALGNTNTYTGNTFVLKGTLALTNNGTISSTNVNVNLGTLDVSGVAGTPALNSLNMTNGTLNVGATTLDVSELNMGGTSNVLNVVALPGFLFYPTNIALVQSAGSIKGYNFTLGNLPGGAPSYAGTLSQNGNAVVLTLSSGPLNVVQATVGFSQTNAGFVLNPAFCGLSYEKAELTGSLFTSNDTSLVSMFKQIAPAVLRIGGNSVNTTCWGGLSNQTPITAAEVAAFAGFVKALPTNWHVIYGINMAANSLTNCAAEAAYAANALGPSLLGFEIGNEPDLYYENGLRSSSYTFSDFVSEWQTFAAAITNAVPGWAITNGGGGWTLTGPASAGNTEGYTVPFATDEAGIISMLTQHYYRANGQSPSSTIQYLIGPDPNLPGTVSNCVAAATAAHLPGGFRVAECGSYYNGGAPNVSDAYGAALWALDFMFTCAENGCQGINFHGGGGGTGYTPIADNGTSVVQARPEFYGLKMFSLADQGNVIPAIITLASNVNFTAYGMRRSNGGISALLNNKATNVGVQVSINLGSYVSAAQAIYLSGSNLNSTNGYTLGGATINPDGSWAGAVQSVTPATNGQLTFIVPPISAVLLNPVILATNITVGVAGNQLSLGWPTNYIGWLLESNSTGLASPNWFPVPGSGETNRMQIAIQPGQGNVFYRLALP